MDQKIPKPKRLQEWYKKMLDKAVAERIVHDYKVRTHFLFEFMGVDYVTLTLSCLNRTSSSRRPRIA